MPKKVLSIALTTCKWAMLTLIVFGFLAGGIAVGYVSALVKDDPVRSKQMIMEKIQENVITGFVYFRDNSVIGQLRTEEDRRLVALQDIPQQVKDAFLAIEDNNFNEHFGIDLNGIFRAVKQQILHEDVQTGGSTITQQLARRVFLNLDRSVNRKAKEIFLSLRLERLLSKDEIFLAYLNKIPFGNGSNGYNVYGIKAAAKGIFDKDNLNDLNIAQAAYLAGLPQQPSNYSAFTSKGEFDSAAFSRAVTRQQLVLKRMLEEEKITQKQYEEALAFDLKASLAAPRQKAYTTYPYLMIEAEKQAAEILLKLKRPDADRLKPAEYNEALKEAHELLLHGGYQIYTTIDKTIYDDMKAIAENKNNFTPDDPVKGVEQIGAIMIENKSGAILGMMEGRSFYIEQLNHATQMLRQPGSTMKPIAAYIPALEKGAVQPGSIIDDVPLILKDGVKGFHLPENWDGKFHGLITAREALRWSYNIPAIKLFLYKVGITEAWDFARKLGITSLTKEDAYAQTGVIGGLTRGVSVKELTGAYASIPNKGVVNETFMVRQIKDGSGQIVYEHETKPKAAYSEETAFLITDMLKTVVKAGTAADLASTFKHFAKVPFAGKTGSTQDDADAWFMGYTPDITVGVWAGYDQPKHTLSKRNCGPSAGCGTQRAKRVWAKIMDAALERNPQLFAAKEFDKPENILEMTVSSVSGKLPNELNVQMNKTVTDLFNKKYIPTEEDDVMAKMKYVTFERKNYLALPTTPEDMVKEQTVIRREKPIAELIQEIETALKKLPPDDRHPIEHYYPADFDSDAPVQQDPRSDDGKDPIPPGGVVLTHSGNKAVVAFEASPQIDVVGYRIYRSVNRGPFQKLDKAVLVGDQSEFQDTLSMSNVYGYYLTAVDAAGRESIPSKTVYSDGTWLDSILLPLPKEVPPAPTNVAVQPKGIGVEIRWSANPREQQIKRYIVYYSDKENGPYKQLHSSESTSVVYYALVYDGWYRVTAVNNLGESKPSTPVYYQKSR